jgi:hypothetical protein
MGVRVINLHTAEYYLDRGYRRVIAARTAEAARLVVQQNTEDRRAGGAVKFAIPRPTGEFHHEHKRSGGTETGIGLEFCPWKDIPCYTGFLQLPTLQTLHLQSSDGEDGNPGTHQIAIVPGRALVSLTIRCCLRSVQAPVLHHNSHAVSAAAANPRWYDPCSFNALNLVATCCTPVAQEAT